MLVSYTRLVKITYLGTIFVKRKGQQNLLRKGGFTLLWFTKCMNCAPTQGCLAPPAHCVCLFFLIWESLVQPTPSFPCSRPCFLVFLVWKSVVWPSRPGAMPSRQSIKIVDHNQGWHPAWRPDSISKHWSYTLKLTLKCHTYFWSGMD